MKVIKFSVNNFAESLANRFTTKFIIKEKNQFQYLTKYLSSKEIGAKTIVIEEEYISKDFLHGYSSYYAYCYENYPKICKRLHFFRNSFTKENFEEQILKDDDDFWENYLGFIVVKPIPITVIGLTVLKTYINGEVCSRNFWGIREYEIHVFGKELKINSLAFQEQDSVIAACATTAIWSMLNKASLDFHTILKSPSEITKDADNVSPDGSRLFPNRGLSLLQICQSIVNSGLVSEVKRGDINHKDLDVVVSNKYLKKILNAYSPIGIPIILVIKVPSGKNYGAHAITVSGYSQSTPQLMSPTTTITWYSDDIEKIYAHDDQWGPFARIEFKDNSEIITDWTNSDEEERPTVVTNIIVPVYPKIRISYENIEVIVLGIDIILTIFFDKKIIADLVWDIKIDYSEAFKNQIKKSKLADGNKRRLLTQNLPKYIWIARCFISGQKVIEILFDATGVNNAMLGIDVICYLPKKDKVILKKFLSNNKNFLKRLINHKDHSNYYDFITKKI